MHQIIDMKFTTSHILIASFIILIGGLITFGLVTSPQLQERGELVAYRGGGQIVDYQKLEASGCTANSIVQSENIYIENTLESLAEADSAGFDIFHINIHLTKDGRVVLFHDWTLDCATNGTGEARGSSSATLAELDAGYGYTFDEGKTYPFRGKGYRIESLETVLDKYPHKKFWLNLKNNNDAAFLALSELLTVRYANRLSDISLITSPKGVAWFGKENPALTVVSVESTKACFIDYMLYGWSGIFPQTCSNRPILLPPSKTKFLWGYPETFAARAQQNGSRVYLWAQHTLLKNYAVEIEKGIGVVTGDIHGAKTLLP
jgi:glycerophosphoryl diester phosphodiesterase